MADSSDRRRWVSSQGYKIAPTTATSVKPIQPRAQDGYDQYLTMLQERNRLLKKLRKKDSHQVEMEKREQGFSLYLNGANLSHRQQSHVHRQTLQRPVVDILEPVPSNDPDLTETVRPSRTADPDFAGGGDDPECSDEASRAKSAPSKRKSWSHTAVRLKTAEGKPIEVPAPEILSGKYEDDFESSVTQDKSQNNSISDIPSIEMKEEAYDGSGSDGGDGGDGGEGGGIAVGFEDISALRESLECDSVIRKSILDSLESGSGSDEEDCLEDLEADVESGSPLNPSPCFPLTRGGGGIVLEFGAQSHHNASHQYSSQTSLDSLASRQSEPKELEMVGVTTDTRKPRQIVSAVRKSAKVPATRSLTATSKKEGVATPKDVESVLEAVQAENTKVDSAASKRSARSLSATIDERVKQDVPPELVEDILEAVEAENARIDSVKGNGKPRTDDSKLPTSSDNQRSQGSTSPAGQLLGGDAEGREGGASSKLSFPLKPVLLKYNAAKASLHHSPPKQPSREALRVDLRQSRSEGEGSGGVKGDNVVSHSLTERTLRVITDKVRNMDAKQQFKLLDLLGKLDGQATQFLSPATGKPRSAQKESQPMKDKDSPKKPLSVRGGNVRGDASRDSAKPQQSSPTHSPSQRSRKDLVSKDSKADDSKHSKQESSDILRKLLSAEGRAAQEARLSPEPADIDIDDDDDDEVWTGVERKSRPSSGRLTGLRGELVSAKERRHWSSGGERGEGSGSSVASQRAGSARMSGLRGEMMVDAPGRKSTESRAASKSGRTTGLRGELTQQDHSMGNKDSPPPPPPPGDSDINREYGPRLHTAVLAKGYRPLLLGASGSDSCLLPEVTSGQGSELDSEDTNYLRSSGKRLSRSEECLSPMPCSTDPQLSGYAHASSTHGLPTTQLNVDDCLASISKFDHSHLGQMGNDMQDDILETFLSEYRQKRRCHQDHPTDTPATPTTSSSHHQHHTPHTLTHSPGQQSQADQPLTSPPSLLSEGEEMEEGEEEFFSIPELPIGRRLMINILSTWGDRFYVGLTGIEVYSASGQLANVEKISADPSDINVLPEYDSDPRVVGNLLDGVNQTRDDMHMWLTPFTPGDNHLVILQFAIPYALALVRIWNYNKSRIHSARGARYIEMFLDGQVIFSGEVARATGAPTNHLWEDSETILFTVNEAVLERVSRYDPVFLSDHHLHHQQHTTAITAAHSTPPQPRPSTAHSQREGGDQDDSRPFTCANLPPPPPLVGSSSSAGAGMQRAASFFGLAVEVVFVENWGDPTHMGLTSIAVLESGSRQPLALRPDQVSVSLPAGPEEGDLLTTSEEAVRLVDGIDITTDDSHMWVCPVLPCQLPSLTITLDTPTSLGGLRVWNYNASMEDSYKGVKLIHVIIDGSPLVLASSGGGGGGGREEGEEGEERRGFLVRRAPGHVQYDFAQDILFDQPALSGWAQDATHDLPRGFVFQLRLLSTWGDPYYVGLNGLEFYDENGQKIPLTANNIAAFPDSVNALPDISNDLRTPDKLVDGVSDTMEGHHMWLAPVLPSLVNSIFVLFDQPQTVSEVRLWNYAKTPSRGVKELALLVDDLLVFTGTAPATPTHARGILPTLHMPIEPFIISFPDTVATTTTTTTSSFTSSLQTQQSKTQQGDVQFVNNRQVMSEAVNRSLKAIPNQDFRPLTSLTHVNQSNSKRWKH